ncbi:MAG: lipopolysaccharide biosynthesis protein [Bacteroidales bacterium]|nr:lipopolysaccharide biosynthesis protein [Bacteroidales bacterium]
MNFDNLKSQAIHGTIWSFVERFSTQAVHFALTIIMARLLTPNDYGLIGMLAIFISLSQVFIDGGFSTALVQRQDRTDEDFSTVFYINLSVSVVIYLILFFCAPLIADFYEQPLLVSITRVYSINLIINSLVAVNKTKLVIKVDFKTQSKISLLVAILSGVLGIVAALNDVGVWALVVQMLAQAVFNVIFSFWFVKWFPAKVFSKKSFRKLFKFGSKLLVAQIISNIYSNIYNVVIGKKFTSSDLGFYTRAHQFALFAGGNISQILQRVTFPLLSQIQDNDKRLLDVYKKYLQLVTFIVFPLIMIMFGSAKPLILILLGDKWSGCIILLQIMSFSCLWDCVILSNLNLLYVKGRSDLILKLEIIKKSIAFSILVISMFFDLIIVCVGQAVYSLIALYLNTIYTKKILNYGFITQMKEILPWLLLSFVIGGLGVIICNTIENEYLAMIFSVTACLITYFGVSFLLKFTPLNVAVELVKEKIKKK